MTITDLELADAIGRLTDLNHEHRRPLFAVDDGHLAIGFRCADGWAWEARHYYGWDPNIDSPATQLWWTEVVLPAGIPRRPTRPSEVLDDIEFHRHVVGLPPLDSDWPGYDDVVDDAQEAAERFVERVRGDVETVALWAWAALEAAVDSLNLTSSGGPGDVSPPSQPAPPGATTIAPIDDPDLPCVYCVTWESTVRDGIPVPDRAYLADGSFAPRIRATPHQACAESVAAYIAEHKES